MPSHSSRLWLQACLYCQRRHLRENETCPDSDEVGTVYEDSPSPTPDDNRTDRSGTRELDECAHACVWPGLVQGASCHPMGGHARTVSIGTLVTSADVGRAVSSRKFRLACSLAKGNTYRRETKRLVHLPATGPLRSSRHDGVAHPRHDGQRVPRLEGVMRRVSSLTDVHSHCAAAD